MQPQSHSTLRIRESLPDVYHESPVGSSGGRRVKSSRAAPSPSLSAGVSAAAAASTPAASHSATATPATASATGAASADPSPWSPASGSSRPATASAVPMSRREQRYLDAQLTFTQLISSPPPAVAAPAGAPPTLPVSLLPFHRAFQESGWKVALATPEDRYSGRHACTSLFALLWLKSPAHVLNHSADRHWLRKVRHIVAARHAASIAGPHSTAAQEEMPPLSEEAEFSLAHALHLPHTIIYSRDDADRGRDDDPLRMRLSSFPEHIWQPQQQQQQRNAASAAEDPADADAPVDRIPDGWIRPSVWYFSRQAFQGQNEILRKNKPLSRGEHVHAVRAAFLKGRAPFGAKGQAKSVGKSRPGSTTRPATAAMSRPGTAATTQKNWREASPASFARAAAAAAGAVDSPGEHDVVAQYTSLDPDRDTHVAFLTARDLEHFLSRALESRGGDGSPGRPSSSRPGTSAQTRASASPGSELSDRARKDRVRQELYDGLYNEMDLIPSPTEHGATVAEPVVAVGTRARRPASASATTATAAHPDPLVLQAHSAPAPQQFRGRKLAAMLQAYVPPPGEHAELLRVEWREEAAASWEGRSAALARNRAARAERARARTARRSQAQAHALRQEQEAKDHSGSSGISEHDHDQREADADKAERMRDEAELYDLQSSPEKRTVCFISRLLNAHPLRGGGVAGGAGRADSPSLYERLCCFSYASSSSSPSTPLAVLDSPVVQGVLYTRLSYVCDLISLHIRSISEQNLSPQEMSLNFQVDSSHRLFLLSCDRITFWHEKALLEGPGRAAEARMARQYLEDVARRREQKRARSERRRLRQDAAAAQERARALAEEEAKIRAAKDASVAEIVAIESATPLSQLHSSPPVGPVLSVLESEEWDLDVLAQVPPPSSRSLAAAPLLRGMYHGHERARSHMSAAAPMHSLKEEVLWQEGQEGQEEAQAQCQPQAQPHLTRAGTPAFARPQSRGVSASPSMATLAESPHESDDEEEEEEVDEEEAEQSRPVQQLQQGDGPDFNSGAGGGAADSAAVGPASTAPATTEQPSPLPDGTDSSSDSCSDLEGGEGDDGVDGLTALLNRKLRSSAAGSGGSNGAGSVPEKHSAWADEVLFAFARKRAQERSHFRRQEEAYMEERAARQQSMFGRGPAPAAAPSAVPAPVPQAGANAALATTGSTTARPTTAGSTGRTHRRGASGQQQQQQGINLLEAGSHPGVPAHMLAARKRGSASSNPAGAYILAKAQRNGGVGGLLPPAVASLVDTNVPGARGLRNQLAHATLELTPSVSKSGWESRGAPLASRSAPGGDLSHSGGNKVESLNFRMRQVTLLAAAITSDQPSGSSAAAGATSASAGAAGKPGPKSHFAHRMRAEHDAAGTTRPLRPSASLTALAASVHSSGGGGGALARSASSTSFAPPPVPPQEQSGTFQGEEEDSDEDEGEGDGEAAGGGGADTFMTSTTLSPRGLASRARAPAPLPSPPRPPAASARATCLSLDALPRTSAYLAPPGGCGYFTCPKCRLSLQIHAVHSTLVVDVLAEWERMASFIREHRHSFQAHLARPGGKGKTKGASAATLAQYNDLTYYSSAGAGDGDGDASGGTCTTIPPAIAFVFPALTPGQYASLRSDPTFLRSTIDLCGDCHALVRVPLHPGFSGEERAQTSPLELREELQQHGRLAPERFANPRGESHAPGLSHASTLARQSLRAGDQLAEEEAFHAGEARTHSLRESLRPGEVDPSAPGAGVVPLEIRRLNQSTMQLLAGIPYNAVELAEFERKKMLAAGGADQERSGAVKAVLDRFRTTKKSGDEAAATAATGGDDGSASVAAGNKRRQIQQQLFISAGLISPPPSSELQPPRAVAHEYNANPFMPPRAGEDSPNKQTSSSASLRHSSSSTSVGRAERVGVSFAEREATRRARRAAQLEADMRSPAALMSRYDPALLSRLGGVASASPAHDAALVQSQQRKARTTEVVDAIIARSAAERSRDALAAEADRWDAPLEVVQQAQLARPPTFLQRFSQHHASKTSQFAPLYAQLTRAKPIAARTVDHIALSLEAKARARETQGRFSGRAPPAGRAASDMGGGAEGGGFGAGAGGSFTERTAATIARSVGSPARAAPPPSQRRDSSPSPNRPSASLAHAALTPLSTSYAVLSPSPYAPHLLTVANTCGQVHSTPLPVGVPVVT